VDEREEGQMGHFGGVAIDKKKLNYKPKCFYLINVIKQKNSKVWERLHPHFQNLGPDESYDFYQVLVEEYRQLEQNNWKDQGPVQWPPQDVPQKKLTPHVREVPKEKPVQKAKPNKPKVKKVEEQKEEKEEVKAAKKKKATKKKVTKKKVTKKKVTKKKTKKKVTKKKVTKKKAAKKKVAKKKVAKKKVAKKKVAKKKVAKKKTTKKK
jgi:hypothetical protein